MIDSDRIFLNLGFVKYTFEYKAHGHFDCYRSSDNHFYKMVHFGTVYAIEYAESEQLARLGVFENAELFEDTNSDDELYQQITAWLVRYA